MEIKKVTREYVVIGNETIWFDEPFDEIPYYFFHQKNYPQSVNTDKIFEMCKNVQQM